MAQLKISQDLFNLLHPVGSMYISTNNLHPKTLFGAFGVNSEWTQVANGYYLMACTSGATNTGGSGTSGAWSGTSGSTALNVDQIPNHNHWGIYGNNGTAKRMAGWGETTTHTGTLYEHGANAWEDLQTGYTGGGQGHTHSIPSHTHSITPKYFKVYCWYRTS